MTTRSIAETDTKHMRSVIPMIARFAKETYDKLPLSAKHGLSPLDLMEDGKIVVLTKAARTYNPKADVKFSTYCYTVLQNHFKDVLKEAHAEKNFAFLYSLDTDAALMDALRSVKHKSYIEQQMRSRKDRNENRIIRRIDAERAFLRAYNKATPRLRRYMIQWLLQPAVTKYAKPGKSFNRALHEFRQEQILSVLPEELCRTIMSDYECRLAIANKVIGLFFTPIKDSYLKSAKFTSKQTVEYDLLPILSPARQKSVVALTL